MRSLETRTLNVARTIMHMQRFYGLLPDVVCVCYAQDVPTLKLENDGVEEEEELDPEEPFNFKIWSQQPPHIQDPFSLPGDELPVLIEPVEAVVPRLQVVPVGHFFAR